VAVQDILRNTPEESSANARAERALELYRTRGREITRLSTNVYRVPSQDGQRSYDVLYGEREECPCRDFEFHGGSFSGAFACKHIMAVGILNAKRRARQAPCSGCGRRRPVRELIELHEDNHDNLTHFHGDMLCRSCADAAGVSY
jgi:hypothetical protein